MKLQDMTDQELIELAISTHNTTQSPDWLILHSPTLYSIGQELARRGYKPRTTTTLSFVRTRITTGGEKP